MTSPDVIPPRPFPRLQAVSADPGRIEAWQRLCMAAGEAGIESVAGSIREALQMFELASPAAVIIDAATPDLSGSVRWLRAANPDVAIVVAGGLEEGAAADILRSGADEAVDDGGDPGALLRSIRLAAVRRERERELEIERERAERTLDSIGDALVTTDADGRVQFVNVAAQGLCGWLAQAALGRPLEEVVRIVEGGRATSLPAAPPDRVLQVAGSHTLVRRDGTHVPIEGTLASIRDRQGAGIGSVLVFRDVSTDRAVAQQMAHSAQHDHLTGLPNRLLLRDRIAGAISIAPRHNKKVAVLFLDLDGFKQINDTLGHLVGDQLLQSVSRRLLTCVRASDTVSRQGGDEFVVLLSEIERPEDAALTARRMIEAIARTHELEQHEVRVTTSIGISVCPDDGTDAEALIRNADTAMYQAKESGRHGYRFYKPAMNLRAVERQEVEESLRQALERDEFVLHFQPKVSLRTGEICGAEALLRWSHPTRGDISPAIFVPVAEASGLIQDIGGWALREACRQAKTWHKRGLGLPRVSVNISPVQFQASRFLEGVFDVLNETGLDPQLLEIEVNEAVLIRHAETAEAVLPALRAAGVELSVDDFGTGYSSLSYLRRYPVQALKIDETFVREIGREGDAGSVVRAVLDMARSLNLRVVAEGVETSEELEFLQYHRCDEAQGYYFSHPLPASQFARLLQDGLLATMAERHYRAPPERRSARAASA